MIELKENLIFKTNQNDSNCEKNENRSYSDFTPNHISTFPLEKQGSYSYFPKGLSIFY